jgi:hypothetical protein
MNDCPDCIADDFNKQCVGYCPVKTIILEVGRNEKTLGMPKAQPSYVFQESGTETL